MKKDINPPVVEDIILAVVQESDGVNQEWISYLVNMKQATIEGVLVSTQGYGEINGERKKTSMFRHFLDKMDSNEFKKIEPIAPEVLALSNEFWVSFFLDGKMYDKKYIFLAESITEENLVNIPVINKRGVMIK